MLSQAKQLRIDAMTEKLDSGSGDLERLRDEKDQEIMILQESVDTTLRDMADLQAVSILTAGKLWSLMMFHRPTELLSKPPMPS
jgi:hypothetical protein